MKIDTAKLVRAPRLLELLFDEATRPSLNWLRVKQKQRQVPYYKIGKDVFFDPDQVRASFDRKNIVREIQ